LSHCGVFPVKHGDRARAIAPRVNCKNPRIHCVLLSIGPEIVEFKPPPAMSANQKPESAFSQRMRTAPFS